MRQSIFACKLSANASYLFYMFMRKPLNKLLFARAVELARIDRAYLLIGGAIG